MLSAKMRLAGETFCRESTRQTHQNWRPLEDVSHPRNAKGNYDWNAIADGRYYVEWYAGGTRRRVSAGVTAAQALEVQRRKHHELEGRKLGIPGFQTAGETVKKPARCTTHPQSMKPCSTGSGSSSATASQSTRSLVTTLRASS